ncbi:hypothetical protein RvY_12654 [Ramazzottius varieornatus]|uniref:Chitin-binding type-2 domain-containing protein n=1 Tax=Ramazzottius varieornatus TaxID=947166 RepID=A0A1D1VM83_RAMVA|nr:hypothetical protein RvY_12654 [Ramazzottius varieornatus]
MGRFQGVISSSVFVACILFVSIPCGVEAKQVFNCTTQSGTFPNEASCDRYWICQYGTALAATCNFGLIYNHKIMNCDWARPEICTLIEGKAVRDWVPAAPPTSAPVILNLAGDVVTNVSFDKTLKAAFMDLKGSSGGKVQLKVNMSHGGADLPQLTAYQAVMAKWRHNQKLLKELQLGAVTQPPTTTRQPGLLGPSNYILPDSVTRAPKKTYTVKPLGSAAVACDKKRCRLPDCYCDAQNIPGDLTAKETPQIVMVTFDDAINGGNIDFLNRVFAENRTNPNGCPVTGTFFLSNAWTDYNIVREVYQKGHEIATHSLSHQDFSRYNVSQMRGEYVGEAEVAQELAGVNMSDIVGMRAPFLAVGGDTMYQMLWENGFLYDSSIPSSQTNPPLWPYTLDSPLPHACFLPPCPRGYFPGLWQVPMTYFMGDNNVSCSMYDACTLPSDVDELAGAFYDNFLKHYNTNRSPFLLSAHSAWYQSSPDRELALQAFMDKVLKLGDVWFVTIHQMLQWMQKPTKLADLGHFDPWKCPKRTFVAASTTATTKL